MSKHFVVWVFKKIFGSITKQLRVLDAGYTNLLYEGDIFAATGIGFIGLVCWSGIGSIIWFCLYFSVGIGWKYFVVHFGIAFIYFLSSIYRALHRLYLDEQKNLVSELRR